MSTNDTELTGESDVFGVPTQIGEWELEEESTIEIVWRRDPGESDVDPQDGEQKSLYEWVVVKKHPSGGAWRATLRKGFADTTMADRPQLTQIDQSPATDEGRQQALDAAVEFMQRRGGEDAEESDVDLEEYVAEEGVEQVGDWRRVDPDDDLASFNDEVLVQWQDSEDRLAVYVEEGEYSYGSKEGQANFSAGVASVGDARLIESKSLTRNADRLVVALDEAVDYLRRTDPTVPMPAFSMTMEGGTIKPLAEILWRLGASKVRFTVDETGITAESTGFNTGVEFHIAPTDTISFTVDQEGEFTLGSESFWKAFDDFKYGDNIPISLDGSLDDPRLQIGALSRRVTVGLDYIDRDYPEPHPPDFRFVVPGLYFEDVSAITDEGIFETVALGVQGDEAFMFAHDEDSGEEVVANLRAEDVEGEGVITVGNSAIAEIRKGVPRFSDTNVAFTAKFGTPLLAEVSVTDTEVDVQIVLADEAVPVDVSIPEPTVEVPTEDEPDDDEADAGPTMDEFAEAAVEEVGEPEASADLPESIGAFELREDSGNRVYYAVDDGTGVEVVERSGVWTAWVRDDTGHRTRLGAFEDRDRAVNLGLDALRGYDRVREARGAAREPSEFKMGDFRRRTGNDIKGRPLQALAEYFPSIDDLLAAPLAEIEAIDGVGPSTMESLKDNFTFREEATGEERGEAYVIVEELGDQLRYGVSGAPPEMVAINATEAASAEFGSASLFRDDDRVGEIEYVGDRIEEYDWERGYDLIDKSGSRERMDLTDEGVFDGIALARIEEAWEMAAPGTFATADVTEDGDLRLEWEQAPGGPELRDDWPKYVVAPDLTTVFSSGLERWEVGVDRSDFDADDLQSQRLEAQREYDWRIPNYPIIDPVTEATVRIKTPIEGRGEKRLGMASAGGVPNDTRRDAVEEVRQMIGPGKVDEMIQAAERGSAQPPLAEVTFRHDVIEDIELVEGNIPDDDGAPPTPPEDEPPGGEADVRIAVIGGELTYMVDADVPGRVQDEAISAAIDTLGQPAEVVQGAPIGSIRFSGSEVVEFDFEPGRRLLSGEAPTPDEEPEPEPEEPPEEPPEDFGRTIEGTFDEEVIEAGEVEEEVVEEEPEEPPEPEPEEPEAAMAEEPDEADVPEGGVMTQFTRQEIVEAVETATEATSATAQLVGSTLREIKIREDGSDDVPFHGGVNVVTTTAKETPEETIRQAIINWQDAVNVNAIPAEVRQDINERRELVEDGIGIDLPRVTSEVPPPEEDIEDVGQPYSEDEIEEIIEAGIQGANVDVTITPSADSLRIRWDVPEGTGTRYERAPMEVQGQASDPIPHVIEALEEWQDAVALGSVDREVLNDRRENEEREFRIDLPEVPGPGAAAVEEGTLEGLAERIQVIESEFETVPIDPEDLDPVPGFDLPVEVNQQTSDLYDQEERTSLEQALEIHHTEDVHDEVHAAIAEVLDATPDTLYDASNPSEMPGYDLFYSFDMRRPSAPGTWTNRRFDPSTLFKLLEPYDGNKIIALADAGPLA